MKRKNKKLNNVRYIKNCINGDTSNLVNNWTEMQAIKDGINVAKGKSGSIYDSSGNAIASAGANYVYSYVTDGIIDNVGGNNGFAMGTTKTGLQCFIIDLGQEYDLDEIGVWHYANDTRTYLDEVTYVSNDNATWIEIINQTMYENNNGKRVNAYTDTYNGYIDNGLILWYDSYSNTGTTRNYTTTTWKNLASSSYTGTVTGATWKYKSLYFDGTNDWVKVAQINPTKITMEVVYKITGTTSANQILIGNPNSGGYDILYLNSGGTLQTEYYINSGYRTLRGGPYEINSLNTVTSSYDQSTIKIYERGLFVDKLEYSGSIGAPTKSTVLAIGANPTGSSVSGGYFKGNVYSVRLYDRVLSDDEINHNYQYDKERFNME